MSIPMTSLAPAFEANIDKIPVPQPTCSLAGLDRKGKEQNTTYIEDNLVLEEVGVLHDCVAV